MGVDETKIIVAGLGTLQLGAFVTTLVAVVRQFGDWKGNQARGIVVGVSGVGALLATYTFVQVTEADVELGEATWLADYVIYFLVLWLLTTIWAMAQYALIESSVLKSLTLKYGDEGEVLAEQPAPRSLAAVVPRDISGNPLYTPDDVM